jgi:hypothetical protein
MYRTWTLIPEIKLTPAAASSLACLRSIVNQGLHAAVDREKPEESINGYPQICGDGKRFNHPRSYAAAMLQHAIANRPNTKMRDGSQSSI